MGSTPNRNSQKFIIGNQGYQNCLKNKKIKYTTQTNDMDQEGTWSIQGESRWQVAGGHRTLTRFRFTRTSLTALKKGYRNFFGTLKSLDWYGDASGLAGER